MVIAVPRQALLLLVLCNLLQNSHGFLSPKTYISKPRLASKLRCSESVEHPPISTSPTKRLSMNDKMLERAKKLRDEALALEGAKDVKVSPENSADLSEPRIIQNKTSRDEFISRFPVERLTMNTSTFTLGAFVSDSSSISAVSSDVYVSVLVDRASEQTKQKLQLDKISGEAIRKKQIAIPSIDNPSQPTSIPEVKETKMLKMGASTEKEVETVFDKFNSLSRSLPLVTPQFKKTIVEVDGPNGEAKYQLQTIKKYRKDYDFEKGLYCDLFCWIMFTQMNNKIPENVAEVNYLKLAFLSVLRDVDLGLKIDEESTEPPVSLSAIMDDPSNYEYFLRADFLKAIVTGEVPSVKELKRLSDTEFEIRGNDDNDYINLWRKSTITRLTSKSRKAARERLAVWGISAAVANDAAATSIVQFDAGAYISDKDSSVPVFVSPSVSDSDSPAEVAESETLTQTPPGAPETGSGSLSKGFDSIPDMNYNEVTDFLNLNQNSTVAEVIEKLLLASSENVDLFDESAAERFLGLYFDKVSLKTGEVLSREGAGRFQVEMLKDLFVVTSVKMSQGAVIFDGTFKGKSSAEFVQKLEERYSSSLLSREVGYTVMMNERFVDLDAGLQQAALDQFLGRTPCVVVYPKSWNTSLSAANDSPKKTFKSALSSLAAVSSAAFAANCLDMFNPASTFMTTGVVPDDFLPLAFMPLTIQYASTLAETITGSLKGFNVTSISVPSYTLFTFGSRALYTSMPKNRNDIFDTAAVGTSVALLTSLVSLFVGLQITADASSEVAAAYPSVSLSLLNTNAVVTQFLSYQLPQAAQLAKDIAASTAGAAVDASATVHLHWLAVAGAVSFIANTLQLIPADNSAGSKLTQAVLGKDKYPIVSIVTGVVKFFVVLPMLFTINALGAVTTSRLLFDYFVISQIAGNDEEESPTAIDNLTEVSEGRRIVLLGLASLFFFSVVPYEDIIHRIVTNLASVAEYVKVIVTTGAVPVDRSLF